MKHPCRGSGQMPADPPRYDWQKTSRCPVCGRIWYIVKRRGGVMAEHPRPRAKETQR